MIRAFSKGPEGFLLPLIEELLSHVKFGEIRAGILETKLGFGLVLTRVSQVCNILNSTGVGMVVFIHWVLTGKNQHLCLINSLNQWIKF